VAAVNHTGSPKARGLQHQQQALELRRAGKSFTEIAQALGLGRSYTHRLVQSAMREAVAQIAQAGDELRAMEVDRLDALMVTVWPMARRGNLGAVDRVLRIMERRARLLGLDAPEVLQVDNPGGNHAAMQIAAAIDQMTIEQLRALATIPLRTAGAPAAAAPAQIEDARIVGGADAGR
jgi:hypothetical protein